MSTLIICILEILLVGLFLKWIYNISIMKALPLAVSLIILILYIGGLAKSLIIALTSIHFLSAMILLYFVYKLSLRIYHKENLYIKISPSFVVLIFFMIIITYVLEGRLCYIWDEFSHWGDIVKAMCYLDDFGTNPQSEIMYKFYPPAYSLIEYYMARSGMIFNNTFIEWLMSFAHILLDCVFIFPFLDKIIVIDKNHIVLSYIKCMCFCGLMFLIPICFYPRFYGSLYVDASLALISAGGFCALYLEEICPYLYAFEGCVIFTLLLTKDSGKLFSLFLISALFISILKARYYSLSKKIAIITMYLIESILVIASWNYILWRDGVENTKLGGNYNIRELFNIVLHGDGTYRTVTWESYWMAFINRGLSIKGTDFVVSYAIIATIGLVLLFAISHKIAPIKKNAITVSFIVILLGATYILGIVATYIFKYSEYEATRLASFERYINTFYLMLSILVVVVYFSYNNISYFDILMIICGTLMISLTVPWNSLKGYILRENITISIDKRAEYSTLVEKIYDELDSGHKLRIISQGDTGYDLLVLRYDLRPATVCLGYYSLGPAKYDGDIWSVDIETNEFQQMLKEVDYLLVYKLDDYFIEKFNSIFEPGTEIAENCAYVVDKDSGRLSFYK